jgi:hypothetical protein
MTDRDRADLIIRCYEVALGVQINASVGASIDPSKVSEFAKQIIEEAGLTTKE